jgi:hypothetical protein
MGHIQTDWLGRKLRRNTDPAPSHAAAEEAVRSGRVSKQAEQLLGLIGRHPGRDVSGLVAAAEHEGLALDRAAISKRLSDLHRKGRIETSSTGTRARRWFVA